MLHDQRFVLFLLTNSISDNSIPLRIEDYSVQAFTMLNSGDKLQKLLTVLFTWVLLLALFFAYEGYFVKSQKEFLSRRGFRVLASLANDLDSGEFQLSDDLRKERGFFCV